MNTLLLKRNYKHILFFLMLIVLSVVFSGTRIISYNFGEYSTELILKKDNIDNSVDIFDETIIHDIELNLTQDDYTDLLAYYKAFEDKLYVKTNIVIDGVTIENVGVKLKGNKVLLGNVDDVQASDIDFSFVVKFDEYIETQSYLGKSEIALISGTIEELRGEYIAGKIFEKYDVIAPDTSFAQLTSLDFINATYLVKEVVDEEFIQEEYGDSNPLIYKAENSFSFTYLGEDPTAYTDLFTQKSLEYNYDLKKLIDVLQFVSGASDEDLSINLSKYIDLENYTKYLAINTLLYGEDSKIALLNSYYMYYDLDNDILRFIPWDSQYGENIENISTYKTLEKIYSIAEIAELNKKDIRELLGKVTGTLPDDLKTKYTHDLEDSFLKDDTFQYLYDNVEDQIEMELNETSFLNDLEEGLDELLR